ncbi:MAG: rhodanese-like domain-containing protein [Myxococcota bacterium]|nr:rhodanese-like domain-containing protein [Myxococcota bacterium]MDW8362032.1 rhodanese-like domain-containing protein [Myxococcales bacterium]
MLLRTYIDQESSTYTYLLADERSGEAVLIDPVLERVERDLGQIRDLGLKLVWALDTHVHADHVTATGTLRERTGCKTGLGARAGTGCADVQLRQGDRLRFGRYEIEVRETPGHTNGCVTYVVREPDGGGERVHAFTGDALLIRGCGRTDFQQGDARTLYRSVHEQIFSLPDETIVHPGHDYQGRLVTTVGEEKRFNPRLGGAKTEDQFVEIMANLKLAHPRQMDRAVPANLHCGVPLGLRVDAEPPADGPWAPTERSEEGAPEVRAEWVAARAGRFWLVDVREPAELDEPPGRLPDARNVPLGELERTAASWDRRQPIVLVCRSGRRSAQAAQMLLRMGFERVASMRGGVQRWAELGLPIAGR